ncbi:MAG TPA: hypothetical protein VF316_06550 [Polyangiaceae bacterium]
MSLRASNLRTATLLALLFGVGALTPGCNLRKKLLGGTASSSSTGTTTTTAATVKTTTTTSALALDTDYDLSSAGAKYKGWSIKGPSGAKVMSDSDGARVVGAQSFDVVVGLDKPDLAAKKKTFDAINKSGTSTVKVSTDSPTLLEWTFSTSGITLYSFMEVETVGATQVTCKNMNGVTSAASLAKAKEACKTIAKM